ncbi:MAG: hypothetical protein ACRYG7_44360 [Janthinobacterium lividum]
MWRSIIDSYWVTVAYPLTLWLAVHLGGEFAQRRYLGRGLPWKSVGVEGGVFGMFGLLLSFTLVASGTAVKARDAIVHTEASSILELHRQAKLYPPELRTLVNSFLQQSLAEQLRHPTPDAEACLGLVRYSEKLSQQFDHSLLAYLGRQPAQQAAVQQVLALASAKNANYLALLYTFRERTPRTILVALGWLSWVMGFLIGFMNRVQDNHSWLVPGVFIVTVTILVTTIRDLDNPGRGVVTPDYDDLRHVQAVLHSDA